MNLMLAEIPEPISFLGIAFLWCLYLIIWLFFIGGIWLFLIGGVKAILLAACGFAAIMMQSSLLESKMKTDWEEFVDNNQSVREKQIDARLERAVTHDSLPEEEKRKEIEEVSNSPEWTKEEVENSIERIKNPPSPGDFDHDGKVSEEELEYFNTGDWNRNGSICEIEEGRIDNRFYSSVTLSFLAMLVLVAVASALVFMI